MPKSKRELTTLPNIQLLNEVWEYLLTRPNKKGEYKKSVYEGLFLLGWKAGLRVSEAINFDLKLEHQQSEYKSLYLLRGKGSKDRWVYISPEIIKELKKRNWQAKEGDRKSYHAFLKQIKKEMNIPNNIELAPHTLRRCFATTNAMGGMPLPVLQKVLGHANLATTSHYVRAGELENLLKYKPI
jgi:integrase/recombinase XerD